MQLTGRAIVRPSFPAAPHPFAVAAADQRTRMVVNAIAVLVFVMAFDGFQELTRAGGTSITNVAGYGAFGVATLRLPAILRAQSGALWFWVAANGIATLLAAFIAFTGPGAFESSAITLWQMMGLWALVTYAVASPWGGKRILKSFLAGMSLALLMFLLMHRLGIRVGENLERTLTVGGYHSNHAGMNAVLTLLLIVGTYNWWGPTWRYLMILGAAPVALYVLMLVNSRGAFVALAAGLLAFLVPTRSRARYRSLQSAGVMVGAVVVLSFTVGVQQTEKLVDRQIDRWTMAHTTSELTTMRSDILTAGLKLAVEQPLGYGIGGAERILGRRMHRLSPIGAHNDYLRTLLRSGFLGLLLYLCGYVLLLRGALVDQRTRGNAWALALLMGLMTTAMSVDLDSKEAWIFLGLIAGLQVRRRTAPGPLPT